MVGVATVLKENFDEVKHLSQQYLKLLSEWKAENDAQRVRLDAMGEQLAETMERIQKTAHECFSFLESVGKSDETNGPLEESHATVISEIQSKTKKLVVELKNVVPSKTKQQKENKQTSTKCKLSKHFISLCVRQSYLNSVTVV